MLSEEEKKAMAAEIKKEIEQDNENMLNDLIEQIQDRMRARDLSDEYLEQQGCSTRKDIGIGEYVYGITMIPCENIYPYLLDLKYKNKLTEKQQKELNNIKEIEKSHKEENGKLRVELEQEKNKINTIKKIMSIGDVTDEALFTLVQTIMAELERLEDIEEQLDKEKEKNKTKVDIKDIEFSNFIKERYVSKDKIKEKIEQAKQKADDDNLDEYIKISAWKELLEEE